MDAKQINALVTAIDRELTWQESRLRDREEARKNGFRKVYKRRLRQRKRIDLTTGLKVATEPVFERNQGVLWMGLKK